MKTIAVVMSLLLILTGCRQPRNLDCSYEISEIEVEVKKIGNSNVREIKMKSLGNLEYRQRVAVVDNRIVKC